MSPAAASASELIARAIEARKAGRAADALTAATQATECDPGSAPAWNMLGLLRLESGEPQAAAASLRKALAHDPKPPVVWFNLARALEATGDAAAELSALDEALARDAYFLPAILARCKALTRLGRDEEGVQLARSVLAGISDDSNFPPAVRAQLAEVRALVSVHASRRQSEFSGALERAASEFPSADLSRARLYSEQRAGRRKVYVQQPTDGQFPFLPAFEYFDRALFPWFDRLEAGTDAIRAELLSLWAEDDPNFRPYVTYAPGTPVNQWEDLNHSPRWSAWFLWENGLRNDANCERCPQTAALVEALPLLDIPGKGPTVMFSVLAPRTRIPAHTGSSNVRTTIHLPLIVPQGCAFRVGGETRLWREGEAWAFDDTIEHEAWNDSDTPRAILILDSWNPLLSEAERAAVRLIG
jgi:aspartate beta-hydroxylase